MSKSEQQSISGKIVRFDELIDWFQGEDFSIEQAADKLRQADALADEIEQQLVELKNDITVLKQKFDQV